MVKQSSKIALGGIVAALSVVFMLLTIIPSMTFVLPAVSGVLLMVVVIEVNKRWAFMVYVAVGLIAMFTVPDRMAAVMYVLFFGYYPILKALLESKLPRVAEWIVKFIVFNASILAAYALLTFVFGIPFIEMDFLTERGVPVWGIIVIALAAGNLVFWIYDLALSRLVEAYLNRWRKNFKRIFK